MHGMRCVSKSINPLWDRSSQTILNAGHGMGSRFLQRQLTRQRTDVERASLHHDIMQLPSTDTRRMAWLSRDKISSAGLTSWPTKKCAMDDTTFSEMLTQFLGRESFMVRHLAGKYIPCSLNQHTTCCKFGFELSSATLPVATFNDPHDEASQLSSLVHGTHEHRDHRQS